MEFKNNPKYSADITLLCLLSGIDGCDLCEPPEEQLAIPAAITFPRIIRSGTDIFIEVAYDNWWGGKFQGQPKEMHIEVKERENNHYLISLIGTGIKKDDAWRVLVLRESLGIGKEGRYHLTLKQPHEYFKNDTEISFDVTINDSINYYNIESNTDGWDPYNLPDTSYIALYPNESIHDCVALDTLNFVRQKNGRYFVEFDSLENKLFGGMHFVQVTTIYSNSLIIS